MMGAARKDNQYDLERPSQDEMTGDVTFEHASQPYIGRWNHLVSTTNWEKGRIISQWREALIDAGAPASEYSDDAWSRRVGGVSGQHVGRLRRAYQRFGTVHEQYEGLYWSHFQAALEWDDAEMWLEGARLSNWSVSQMRHQRWEALGAIDSLRPRDDEIILSERDEDFEPALDQTPQGSWGAVTEAADPDDEPAADASTASPRTLSREREGTAESSEAEAAEAEVSQDPQQSGPVLRPFEHVGEFPEDLADAFDAFKLAILHHKGDQWRAVDPQHVLAALQGLQDLVVAAS